MLLGQFVVGSSAQQTDYLVFIFDVLRVAKMEFENNVWVNMLKSAHKTSLLQDGMFKHL